MKIIEISAAQGCAPTLAIGKRGENLATQVRFDFSAWAEEFGEGRAELYARRCGDENPYPVTVTVEGQEAVWTLTATDTHVIGYGTAEFVWIADETIVKSVVFGTIVEPDIGAPTDTPPEPYESWLDTLTELAADTQEYAERAETAQGKAEDAQAGAEAAQAATEEALGPVEADVAGLKTASAYTDACIAACAIPYAKNGTVSATGGPRSFTQAGNLMTIDGTSNATANQYNTKLQGCGACTMWNAFATPDDAKVYPLALRAGRVYRLSAKVISGTRDDGGGTGNLTFRFYGDGETNLAQCVIGIGDSAASVDYAPDADVKATIRCLWARLMTCTNLVLEVMLRDVTEEVAVAGKADAEYTLALDWAEDFGTSSDELGWHIGYWSHATGGIQSSSTDMMRSNNKRDFVAAAGETRLTFTVPSGYKAQITEYESDGTFIGPYGDYMRDGTTTAECALTEGNRYRFTIGNFNGDSDQHITAEFLAGVHAVVRRTVESRDEEQEARLKALETADADTMPDYYRAYLPARLNAITAIQRSISPRNDAFLFVADYHKRSNAGHSLALMKEVGRKTGIRRIFFAGDACSDANTEAKRISEMQVSAEAWTELSECTDEFYGVIGNHEILGAGLGTMYSVYHNRFTRRCGEMATYGSYFVDDPARKIRYYFMQFATNPALADFDWMGKTLETIGDGWWVAIVAHHGYIPSTASAAEYDNDGTKPDMTGGSSLIAKAWMKILQAYQEHTTTTVTLAGVDYDYDFTGLSGGGAIGVFCGHIHHGTLFERDHEENIWGIPVFRGGTDSLWASTVAVIAEGKKVPWYWEGGVIGGTKVPRERGSTDEQCFYAVNIDLEEKKCYITAIGGDHDWEFDFGPAEASTADSEG